MARILILCTGNSARSQMGEAWLRSFDPSLEVHSAGTVPAPRVNPFAVEAMREVGIDISSHWPKQVDEFTGQAWDHVITVCSEADTACPVFPGSIGRRTHIGFNDPAAVQGSDPEILAAFREVRDEIRARLREYYEKEVLKNQ